MSSVLLIYLKYILSESHYGYKKAPAFRQVLSGAGLRRFFTRFKSSEASFSFKSTHLVPKLIKDLYQDHPRKCGESQLVHVVDLTGSLLTTHI